MLTPKEFQRKLLSWFAKEGRFDLPWQKNQTPYRVWVSEIMLQQTQVSTVIPYYQAFIKQFPNIKQLSLAPEDQVFHFWSGLGFYARARNLHKTAKIIHEQHHGRFPNSVETLTELPGIGRSTAGAILSLAMDTPSPILDGNVKRVLARTFMLDGYPEDSKAKKNFWTLSSKLTPKTSAKDYTQAIMDLGATICTRTQPLCHRCPFTKKCLAKSNNKIAAYPAKKAKKPIPKKQTYLLILQNEANEIFLEKRPATGIWGGLWSFPECDEKTKASSLCQAKYHCNTLNIQRLESFKHVFTHFELTIHPLLIRVKPKTTDVESEGQIWYNSLTKLPGGIPKPVTKLFRQLAKVEK